MRLDKKDIFYIFTVTLLLFVSQTLAAPADLDGAHDAILQQDLERHLRRMGLEQAVADGKLAVALVDITDEDHPRVAAVNGDKMMYAASLPKIAILFGAFKRIEAGEMRLDAETRDLLIEMIRHSSNQAASEMLDRVGKPWLARLLQSSPYRLYDPARNGGLWVGKAYGRNDLWKRDPLHHLSHGATALQVARFYYLLERGELVSPALTAEMMKILSKPGITHKFVKGLTGAYPNARIYRKSGTWKQWHADSALVEHDGKRYIAVALAESPEGGKWMTHLIVALDKMIKAPAPSIAVFDHSEPVFLF